ncbi:DapH/DapD/GlmU-related protein [Herbaspirillum hiltneri]|uniref:DapH/DapD/GlmU-related protein n=1 Tax=Herbaspirillum hiltneri TaxID=341045 RepID=UPI00069D02CD|nr:DapH/DapD/GlmU-related protein [Herbaspirillum hiltneri]
MNRILSKLLRLFVLFRVRRTGATLGSGVVFYGSPQIKLCMSSSLSIGARTVICSDSDYTALALNHKTKISTIRAGASIEIGSDVGISGACIVCAESIRIGSEVLLGANVLIVDSDFHPINPVGRRHSDDDTQIGVAPVVVGDNVFIGTRATLLKGVSIGKDSVVAAGAVVAAGNYVDGAILAGNPARIIGSVYKE